MSIDETTTGPAVHYRRTRERLAALLATLGEGDWQRPVAACPGWDVHDVLAHLVAVTEDALSGELTGPPDDAHTAKQVARHRDDAPAALLERWASLAPQFEELIAGMAIWPPAFDVASHEHDIRTALDRPGARDDALIVDGARLLVEAIDVDAIITFDLDGETARTPPKAGPDYAVRTSAFEVFRLRLGRRSRDQVAALDWSRDPAPVLDALFYFGPARAPLHE